MTNYRARLAALAKEYQDKLGDGTALCRCGHAEGYHVISRAAIGRTFATLTGACAVHRGDGGPECGCERFIPTCEKEGAK